MLAAPARVGAGRATIPADVLEVAAHPGGGARPPAELRPRATLAASRARRRGAPSGRGALGAPRRAPASLDVPLEVGRLVLRLAPRLLHRALGLTERALRLRLAAPRQLARRNLLTFNPGWNHRAETLEDFQDVRELQRTLKARGLELQTEADENGDGPASFVLVDPDGNPILVDQHVPKPKR
jgi:hypothetical protein